MRMMAKICCGIALFVSVGPLCAGDEAEPREIIVKAIAAHGGAATIKRLKASVLKSKGKFHGKGFAVDFTSETAIQMPDRTRQQVAFDVNDQKGSLVWVFDGDKGWLAVNGTTADMTKEMIAEGQEQQYMQSVERLIPLTEKSYKLSSLGEEKVGGHAARGVRVEREGHRPVDLFFDKESGLLRKSVTRGKSPMSGDQEFTVEKIYDDYQKVDGLMVARKITIKHDGKDFASSEVTDVQVSEELDASLFAKP